MKIKNEFLFVGLSHIGQVFSICWAKKFGKASIFDFDYKRLNNFKNCKVTNQEPSLKELHKKFFKRIKIINLDEIENYQNIFLSLDTDLSKNSINTKEIEKSLLKLFKHIKKNANLILVSQVPPGFTRRFNKKLKNINLIYMVDTLEMGTAVEKFLKPEMIIFGSNDKKLKVFEYFKKFNCPIFIKDYEQAEIIKILINIYLASSVSFANFADYFCKNYNFNFSSIKDVLKNDKRIGKYSYINSSLGFSGGHLERDIHYVIKYSKVKLFRKSLQNFLELNSKRINILLDSLKKITKNFKISKKIIYLGISYKKNSFSLKNSIFLKFKKSFNRKFFYYDSFYSNRLISNKKLNFFNIKKNNFDNSIFIYNYLSDKDLDFFKKKIKLSKNVDVINIDLNAPKFNFLSIF